MTDIEAKNELIKRYKYLNENIKFILIPHIYENAIEYNKVFLDIDEITLKLIEDFLFTEDKTEESLLYYILEDYKQDKEYLLRVEEGTKLLEKENCSEYLKNNLNLNNLLHRIGNLIDNQTTELSNKKNKLLVLDEYFRLLRYKNDGKIYTSGRQLDLHDCSSVSIQINNKQQVDKNYTGTLNNKFIELISNMEKYQYNKSIFTEEEKQEVYLQTHEDLPYYLEINCELEEEYIKTMIDSRLCRPENTSPCHETFKINKNEIFIKPDDKLYRYYQLCPHCGYIVNIPKEIIPESVKQEIEERCLQNPNLFRQQYLTSELKSLENKQLQRTLKK